MKNQDSQPISPGLKPWQSALASVELASLPTVHSKLNLARRVLAYCLGTRHILQVPRAIFPVERLDLRESNIRYRVTRARKVAGTAVATATTVVACYFPLVSAIHHEASSAPGIEQLTPKPTPDSPAPSASHEPIAIVRQQQETVGRDSK